MKHSASYSNQSYGIAEPASEAAKKLLIEGGRRFGSLTRCSPHQKSNVLIDGSLTNRIQGCGIESHAPDFIETRIAALIRAAKRSGYFADVIDDAKHFHENDGYAWDVALAMSCEYWCR